MPTTKKRVNISLSKDTERALSRLAERDRMPQATKAARLIEIALETEEDRVWDAIAHERDTKNARFIPHQKVWA